MDSEENGPSPTKRVRLSEDHSSCAILSSPTGTSIKIEDQQTCTDLADGLYPSPDIVGGEKDTNKSPCETSNPRMNDETLQANEEQGKLLDNNHDNGQGHYEEHLKTLNSDEENFNRFLKEELQRVAAENAAKGVEEPENKSEPSSADNHEKQQTPVKTVNKSSNDDEQSLDGPLMTSAPPCTPANSPELIGSTVTGGLSRSPFTPIPGDASCNVALSPGYQLLSPQSQAHVERVVLASSPTHSATLPGVQTLISNKSLGLTPPAPQVVYSSDLSTLRAVASIPMPSPCSSNSSGDEDWETTLSPRVVQQFAVPQQPGSSQYLGPPYRQVIQTAPLVHVVQQPYQSLITGHHQILNWQTGTQPIMVSTPVNKKMVTAQTAMPCASQNLSAYNAQLKKQVYHGTPHPVLTGRTVTPNAPVTGSAGRQSSAGKMHTSTHQCSFATPGSCRSMHTPVSRLSQLSLNSSGSEEERSPPEQHSFRANNVPYNTPVSGVSTTKIPSAADLQAALLRTRREPIDPAEMGAGREQHNAKERARRARIKGACDNLREMMPGNMVRTDKATLMELAVEYIKHLRNIVGEAYDRDFLKKTTPYLNMEME